MTRATAAAIAAAACLLAPACAGRRPPTAPPAPPSAPPPTQAPPSASVPGTVLEGVASWYGPDFQGKRTASGERFDQDGLTAAHATLPFGTLVQVTNLENGRSVVVRVNDRPGNSSRIIDLSRAAGKAIGLIGPGTARVRLEVVSEPGGASR